MIVAFVEPKKPKYGRYQLIYTAFDDGDDIKSHPNDDAKTILHVGSANDRYASLFCCWTHLNRGNEYKVFKKVFDFEDYED